MACLGEGYVFSEIDLSVGEGVRIEIYIKEINPLVEARHHYDPPPSLS